MVPSSLVQNVKTFGVSLRSPQYRWLWLNSVGAGMTNWALLMGISWLTDNLSQSTFWVGLTVFAQMVPAVVLAPVAGLLNDRFERRRVLVFSSVLASFVSGGLVVLAAFGQITIGVLAVAAFVFGASHTVQMISSNALLPLVVPSKHLLNGVALQRVASHGTILLGALFAGPLLVNFGPSSVFALSTVLSVLSLFASLKLKMVNQARSKAAQLSMRSAVQYMRASAVLGTVMLMVAMHCILTMSYMSLLPAFVQDGLGQDSSAYGYLMSAVGLGSALGALALCNMPTLRLRGRLYVVSAVGSGLFLITFFLSTRMFVVTSSAVLIGITQTMFMVLSAVWVQELTDDAYRGRITSIFIFLAGGMMSIANWVFGAIAAVFDPVWLMVIVGSAFIVLTLFYVFLSANYRALASGEQFFRADQEHPTAVQQ